MSLNELIELARENGASDLHLEGGMPATLRVRGALRPLGEPLPPGQLLEAAKAVIGPEHWPEFLSRRSFDLSRTIHGVRCRINVLHTARGVGFAIRLLSASVVSLEKLNLHPDLRKLVHHPHGLILMSGPTGSGKSSTMAALIHEINHADQRHIITVEHPIEYFFRPVKSFIRQREVGRDTPSFEQALLDALREDFDVLMVGEMRDPETMRLTLSAAETGHLVLATVHSSTCAEALQRVVSAFPAEIQGGVRAQLADCLLGVISQRLRFRPEVGVRIPECEILMGTHAVKAFVRQGDFFKIASALETGADHGMWSLPRYQSWLEKRTQWHLPSATDKITAENADDLPLEQDMTTIKPPMKSTPKKVPDHAPIRPPSSATGAIEITPHEGGLEDLLRKL